MVRPAQTPRLTHPAAASSAVARRRGADLLLSRADVRDNHTLHIRGQALRGEGVEVESYRVVIVDDYADLRSLLVRFLERSGSFTVAASCETARDGIDAARTEQPDLVLVDLGLPDMNGLDALGPLREAAPSARIVVLSASEPEGAQRAALQRGADAYVDKSRGGDELPGLLLEILAAANSDR